MQFDPFREIDRSAEQLAAGARTPRPFPMDAPTGATTKPWFRLTCPAWPRARSTSPSNRTCSTIKAERRFDHHEGDELTAAERPHGAFTRQLFLGDTLDAEWRTSQGACRQQSCV